MAKPNRSNRAAAKGWGARISAELQAYFERLLRAVPTGPDGIARVRARQIYILPTRAGVLFGGMLFVMLLGSLNYQNNLGLLFTFFLASVAIIAMHHAWLNLLGLSVQARGGQAVFAGETAAFELTLRAEGRHRHDIAIVKRGEPTEPVGVSAGDQRLVKVTAAALRRGQLRLGRLRLETHHPMHLFRAWCYLDAEATTLVYPAPAAQAPDPTQDGGDNRRPHRHRGDGAEDYLGSRGYRAGDSPRHIDWKAFARERGLLVKEYGGEEGKEAWIDWAHLRAPDPEARLSLMARQVLDADQARIRFGLRLPSGGEPLASGSAHTQRCLTRLALFAHG